MQPQAAFDQAGPLGQERIVAHAVGLVPLILVRWQLEIRVLRGPRLHAPRDRLELAVDAPEVAGHAVALLHDALLLVAEKLRFEQPFADRSTMEAAFAAT